MGILRTDTISGIGSDGPIFDGVTKFDTQGYVVPPSGTTDQRSAGITTAQGTIRFNTDSQKLEFYAQDQWWEMVIDTPDLGVSSNTGAGARGIIGAGYNDGATNRIDYITISSTGNSIDFGDATVVCSERGQGFASSTRGIFNGGRLSPSSADNNTIDYITISSTGNASDFGDLTAVGRRPAGCSNSTRGLTFNGNSPLASNIISYSTIASTGNAQDFGDLTDTANEHCACASPTRGVIHLGSGVTGSQLQLDFVTISTTGNAQDFGLLSLPGNGNSATSGSNATRGLFSAFYASYLNYIEYITIATTGNSTHFGDLTQASKFFRSTMASPTRAVIAGGRSSSNVMEYVNIQTEGNSVDFGDLTQIFAYAAGFSNAHGGL